MSTQQRPHNHSPDAQTRVQGKHEQMHTDALSRRRRSCGFFSESHWKDELAEGSQTEERIRARVQAEKCRKLVNVGVFSSERNRGGSARKEADGTRRFFFSETPRTGHAAPQVPYPAAWDVQRAEERSMVT